MKNKVLAYCEILIGLNRFTNNEKHFPVCQTNRPNVVKNYILKMDWYTRGKYLIYGSTKHRNNNQWRSLELRSRTPNPESKVHGANMGPTCVLSAPGGPHIGLTNLAICVVDNANLCILSVSDELNEFEILIQSSLVMVRSMFDTIYKEYKFHGLHVKEG